jgi:hypothetical protein
MPVQTDPSQAIITDNGRAQIARQTLGQVTFILAGFRVGTSGYLPLAPTSVVPIVSSNTDLISPVWPSVSPISQASGTGATITNIGGGIIQVTGVDTTALDTIPKMVALYGSAISGNNGIFPVKQRVSSDTYYISNPAAVFPDATAFHWNVYKLAPFELVETLPSPVILAPVCKIPRDTSSTANYGLGELGVYAYVLATTGGPPNVGDVFLFSLAHFPMFGKTSSNVFVSRELISY